MLNDSIHNPDVLSCLANLSNDEVFTPPGIVNDMLDLLPPELFRSPKTTFLDPFCKSGVFLREIAKRLLAGLEKEIPDRQKRVDHVMQKQLFGIGITQMTAMLSRRSLYCSKDARGKFAVSRFVQREGNIRFQPIEHDFEDGRCKWCGVSESQFGREVRGPNLESHAYEFIHTDKPEEIFSMKFDVIVGNPPYQLADGGAQASATPIYNLFINQAKKLNPRFLTMIVPARWYGGGKGLDAFRDSMLKDGSIRVLHDYVNADECFGNGVEIKGGVCYFLWNRDKKGLCKVFTHSDGNVIEQPERPLCESGCDVFVRYAQGVSVLHKVMHLGEKTFDKLVSSQKPFGLRTFVHGKSESFPNAITLYERGGVGYIRQSEIEKNEAWVSQDKIFISAAYNAGDAYPHQILGKPIPGGKGSCCTETYVVIGPFRNKTETLNVCSYIKTRFFRFLVMLKKTSQHAAASVYSFVPQQDFSKPWTDAELYAKYKLTDDEIAFIESMIKPME